MEVFPNKELLPDSSIKEKMFNPKDITQQKGWVCVMEDGTTIEVEGFSEAHRIPNKRALMSTPIIPPLNH
jgi:hypothetical protein